MQTLHEKLKQARSEEDVKDIYIKALGLKSYSKDLIDICTKEIWFEAKDTAKNSSYAMFTQLLHYAQDGLNKGETVPPFLAVIDTEKAAIMKTADVLPFLAKETVKWDKSASQYPKEALAEVSAHIGTHFVSFRIATHEDEFISTVNALLDAGRSLWQAYFAQTDVYSVREDYKLNCPDVGWYQIRNALKLRNTNGDGLSVDFSTFESAYKTLTEKLQPQVFELGFLRT
ncbi:hypothetical protein JCM14076_20880 [Methylosoma difficile]